MNVDAVGPGPAADGAAVSVLIPVWDEEETIQGVVGGALAACAALGVRAECVVCVDARTTDRSAQEAKAAGGRVVSQTARGLTAAVLQAAEHATAPVAVVLDGDGQHDPTQIADLLQPLLAGDADVVCGARNPDTLRGGYGNGASARLRHLGSILFGRLAAGVVAAPVPDPLTGMFACRTTQLSALINNPKTCPPGGYKLLLALLAATPPHRITHITIGFAPRAGGTSHMNLRTALTLTAQLAHLTARRRHRTIRLPPSCD